MPKRILRIPVLVFGCLILILVVIVFSSYSKNVNGHGIEQPTALILAEYQAWHGLPSHSQAYQGGLGDLVPRPYDSRDPSVIARHIQSAQDKGISGFVVDWYGPPAGVANDQDREFIDNATAELFFQAEGTNFKVALMYDQGTIFRTESDLTKYTGCVISDLTYAEKYYFSPAYLWINGHPSLFIFPHCKVDPFINWAQVREELNTRLTLIDKDPYPENPGHDSNFDGFYAWVQATNGEWDDAGEECGEKYLDWFYRTMNSGSYVSKIMVGGVWPGFDDLLAPWTEGRYMSRKYEQLYDQTWSLAEIFNTPIVLIDTWNDFEEGTDIEFGVAMVVDMDNPNPNILLRSSPLEVIWDPDLGEVPFQVYKQGTVIYEAIHSPGIFISLQSNSMYELKIWISGTPLAKWIKIRRQDPMHGITPIMVD